MCGFCHQVPTQANMQSRLLIDRQSTINEVKDTILAKQRERVVETSHSLKGS